MYECYPFGILATLRTRRVRKAFLSAFKKIGQFFLVGFALETLNILSISFAYCNFKDCLFCYKILQYIYSGGRWLKIYIVFTLLNPVLGAKVSIFILPTNFYCLVQKTVAILHIVKMRVLNVRRNECPSLKSFFESSNHRNYI